MFRKWMYRLLSVIKNPKRVIRQRQIKNHCFDPSVLRLYDVAWLKKMDFSMILDIGAARGDHSLVLNYLFPNAIIHAFEPLPESYRKLVENVKNVKNILTYNLALDRIEGHASLFLGSDNMLDSSSLLPMATMHKEAFPNSDGKKSMIVKTVLLDDIITLNHTNNKIMIKLDVQGAEKRVIEGGNTVFSSAAVVIAEASFRPLYESAPDFDEFYRLMFNLGFKFQGIADQTYDFRNRMPLQCDSIFTRDNPA